MQNDRTFTYQQTSAYASPRPLTDRLLQMLWALIWNVFCAWTPKPCNAWRLLWLRLFGARLQGKPFVHPTARIHVPWNLIMHDRSALGENVTAYSLAEIELQARCTVGQETYLCTGTHDFSSLNLPLVTAKIVIGPDAFLGARSFIMPGIVIGEGAVVGACSVVTADVAPWTVAAGNPCRTIKSRIISQPEQQDRINRDS